MLYGPFFPHLRIHGLSRLQPGSAIEQVNILNSFWNKMILLMANGKQFETKSLTRNSWAINSSFAMAYGVFVETFPRPRPRPFFPLPFPLPRPFPVEALAFATGFSGAAGARGSLRAATRSLWLCGVTGFCLPKTLFRTGGGMEDMGVVTSKVNSASIVAFDQQKEEITDSVVEITKSIVEIASSWPF